MRAMRSTKPTSENRCRSFRDFTVGTWSKALWRSSRFVASSRCIQFCFVSFFFTWPCRGGSDGDDAAIGPAAGHFIGAALKQRRPLTNPTRHPIERHSAMTRTRRHSTPEKTRTHQPGFFFFFFRFFFFFLSLYFSGGTSAAASAVCVRSGRRSRPEWHQAAVTWRSRPAAIGRIAGHVTGNGAGRGGSNPWGGGARPAAAGTPAAHWRPKNVYVAGGHEPIAPAPRFHHSFSFVLAFRTAAVHLSLSTAGRPVARRPPNNEQPKTNRFSFVFLFSLSSRNEKKKRKKKGRPRPPISWRRVRRRRPRPQGRAEPGAGRHPPTRHDPNTFQRYSKILAKILKSSCFPPTTVQTICGGANSKCRANRWQSSLFFNAIKRRGFTLIETRLTRIKGLVVISKKRNLKKCMANKKTIKSAAFPVAPFNVDKNLKKK